MDLYIYAQSDEEAVLKAQSIAQNERKQYDNRAKIKAVHKIPFGQIGGAEKIFGDE